MTSIKPLLEEKMAVSSTSSSPYIQQVPVAPIPANRRHIVSIPADHPDSINLFDIPQHGYLSQCWSLCQDVVAILPSRPSFQEALKSLCNHKYSLKPAALRSDDLVDGLSIIFQDTMPQLASAVYQFQSNDTSLVWELFPDNAGDFGECTRKKTTFSGKDANLCHFTYIKGNNDPQTNFPTTISHPKGKDFKTVLEHCESLFHEILNHGVHPFDTVGLKGEQPRQKIVELHWWMGQGGLFKNNEKQYLPHGKERKIEKNINGPYIEIFIAALNLYKFKQVPNYIPGASSYHLAVFTSLEEFKILFPQTIENRV